MLAKFFVDRPIFAWVIAIIIMLAGAFSISSLPISQYPDVAPPSVRISATYTGASAENVENSVTQIIEQQLTGIDGLLYFSSTSSSSGSSSINVTLAQGTNPDTAQVQVQNKVQQALSRLPSAVQQQGVTVVKSQSDFLMITAIYDVNDKASATDIADYLVSNIQDPVARVEGVGGVTIFGDQHAMRIWLNPSKLNAYALMPSDIQSAIEAQNAQVSAGNIGGMPTSNNQELNATVTSQSKLQTVNDFKNIIVKYNSTGAAVKLSDVARVEMGSERYSNITRLNRHPAAGLAVQLAPGANAMTTATSVRTLLNELQKGMPSGYQLAYPKDSTQFIKISITEVVKTLIEAILLVIIVMFVFLQNWRATIIPAIAVPVVLLGTFGILNVFGYSINTLTMFGMVLSIGLLVDDAIVVVENIERLMREEGLNARDATIKSMQEITSALIGITTVLSAVFLPMAFFDGSTGVIYRQFSITIVSSMVLSVIVAITLTPALCASLLKPHDEHAHKKGFSAWFNQGFERLTRRYHMSLTGFLAKKLRWVFTYLLIIASLSFLLFKLPTSFLPTEDQGEIMVQFSLPSGASVSRTIDVAKKVEDYFIDTEKNNTSEIFTISGFNFSGSGQNAGMAFIALKNWDDRKGTANAAQTISNNANGALRAIRDAQVFTLMPPAIRGLGNSGGFEMQLQANAGTKRDQLKQTRDALLKEANNAPMLTAVRTGTLEDTPQLKVNVDNAKSFSLGLSLTDINSTLTAAWAGNYVNDFIDQGRVKKVYMQGDAPFRSKPEDINQWFVRGNTSAMTPFSSFATTEWTYGPDTLSRYNGLASYPIQGSPAEGMSSGDAMNKMEEIVNKTRNGNTFAWSGLSYQERLASGQSTMLYTLSILVVFLCLAALYESWTVPFSVILVIPLGVFGAVLATTLRGLENDVYFQVALLTTVGLSAKNAILIIEFAEAAYQNGAHALQAVMQAAELRLRPILMTSIAFIAGVMPLALSTGAGAASRVSIGTGILGGTLSATVLAVFFVPLFFVMVRGIFAKRKPLFGKTARQEATHD
jgi:multidrug efflux pump